MFLQLFIFPIKIVLKHKNFQKRLNNKFLKTSTSQTLLKSYQIKPRHFKFEPMPLP